jgi:hypothetical protein
MSDEIKAVGAPGEGDTEPKRKGWPKGKPRNLASVVDRTAEDTDAPVVQVTNRRNAALERRLAKGSNPHATGSRNIPLKEPSRWQLYVGNNYNSDDDLYRIVHEYGWAPLELSDLACKPEDIGYRVNETGHLVRGPQGREVIFKMAIEDYRELMRRKTERNNQGIGSARKTRQQVAEAAATTFGPEAGDYIEKHVTGEVRDSRESRP